MDEWTGTRERSGDAVGNEGSGELEDIMVLWYPYHTYVVVS